MCEVYSDMFYLSREVNYYMPIVQFNTHKPEYIHNTQALIMNYWFEIYQAQWNDRYRK